MLFKGNKIRLNKNVSIEFPWGMDDKFTIEIPKGTFGIVSHETINGKWKIVFPETLYFTHPKSPAHDVFIADAEINEKDISVIFQG